jgi:carbon storage regulator
MLVLSRKVGERIQIGDQIVVTVVRINATTVRLGIEAPGNLAVVREELVARLSSAASANSDAAAQSAR